MSSVALLDKQKANERKAQAMRMNYTKVKPTVVKHVLPNVVMHLREPEVSRSQPQLSKLLCLFRYT